MSLSRYFGDEGPERPHLSIGEVRDLRNDVEDAFEQVDVDIAKAIVEIVAPASGVNTAVVRARFPGRTVPVVFEFVVCDDADGAFPAANATLDTATIGTILRFAGTAAPKVKTAQSGADQVFQCALSNLVDQTNYLTAFSTPAGQVIVCVGSTPISFIP